MKYLPLFLNIHLQPCLLVGGGQVAKRRLEWLRNANATVTVVAPELHPDILAQVDNRSVFWIKDIFRPEQMKGCTLVVCATNDATVNRAAAQAAHARQLPVNVVDDPEQGNIIVPAIIERDPVVVAIISGGASPVLVRWLRNRIESLLSSVSDLLSDSNAANSTLVPHSGTLFLIGTGTGDADLLTLRALACLQQADMVFCDGNIAAEISNLARTDAEQISMIAGHKIQTETIPLVIEHLHQGKKIAWLVAGDAFSYGNGTKLIELLSETGLRYEIIPGVTTQLISNPS
jgi:uroporphyrin-III C-methyltransferase/precorrin-2 dehydrogenase/sirohydrochlorin ferrochelatase